MNAQHTLHMTQANRNVPGQQKALGRRKEWNETNKAIISYAKAWTNHIHNYKSKCYETKIYFKSSVLLDITKNVQ